MTLPPMTTGSPRAPPAPEQNHLLAALPVEVQSRLFPQLELVALPLGHVLYEPAQAMHHVYFPIDSIISLLCMLESGASVEVSVVGNEGIVGVALCLGSDSAARQAIVVSAGFAYRLPRQIAMEELNRHGEMQALALRYTQCLITQMAQTVACNRYHTIDEQLCRWLLLSTERLTSNRLAMTHELIASMLGVRREGITEAASKLHHLGVINYSRGQITVLDRVRLLALSCECYAVVKKEVDRLLPFGSHAPSSARENPPPPHRLR